MLSDSQFAPKGTTPDNAIPEFFLQPVHLAFKSTEAGRDIYEDREFVRIITPGAARSIPCEEVTDEHKRRWPRSYEAFKANMEEPTTGLPLEKWPGMTPAVVANLKALHIRTVEDLASVLDPVLEDIGMGGLHLRKRAQDYLAAANSAQPLAEANARAERAEQALADMEARYADLASRVSEIEAPRRGPGRPPKAREEDQEAA